MPEEATSDTATSTTPTGVIAAYYDAVHRHDWEALASTLSDDVVRRGILSDCDDDVVVGKQAYLDFCRSVIGSFSHHSMEVVRIFCSSDGSLACAETVETIQRPGEGPIVLHCLKVHELDGSGRIAGIDQYRKGSTIPTPASISAGAVREAG